MVTCSTQFAPPLLKGLRVRGDSPFRLDFILDQGDALSKNDVLKEQSAQLVKYFMAALTVPEQDLWVNLSPYEKDRIITNEFGQTEMGRDLLAQDYVLKQLTASIVYPESESGRKFWQKVYQTASQRYGTIDIPVDTFNKVWITPAKAVVYEKTISAEGAGDGRPTEAVAYVVESKLKVLLESDYKALHQLDSEDPSVSQGISARDASAREMAKEILREVVIPLLEKEVNEGQNFAKLRQVYNSLILASWYKKKIKDSLLASMYVDQKKVAGINIDDRAMAEKIWNQYLEAFKRGVFNFVQEERDMLSSELIPRKYFSGGVDAAQISRVLTLKEDATGIPVTEGLMVVGADLEAARSSDLAQLSPDTDFKLLTLLQTPFENKSMADFVTWVDEISAVVTTTLTDQDIDELRKMLGLGERMIPAMRKNAAMRAYWANEFNRSLPADKKNNVYLMRDGVLLYLAEQMAGKKKPLAAYLSKQSFSKITGAGGSALLLIPAMIFEVKTRLGWEAIPEGAENLRLFKEEFYKLFQELVSEKPVALASPQAREFLPLHRQDLRTGAAALQSYLPSIGLSSQEIATNGVRFIDTTMTGTFVLFMEAITRALLEQQGYQNAAELVDSKMFFGRLSAEMSFLNPARDQNVSRALELSNYPVDFRGETVDGIRPKGDVDQRREFLMNILLFKSEMLKLGTEAALAPKQTIAGRNVDTINLVTSPIFAAKTGLDLKEGSPLVVDVGVGEPADTTIELKQSLARQNPNVQVIGTELPQATARAHVVIGPGKMLEDLKSTMRQIGEYPVVGDVLEAVFVLTDTGAPEYAGVSEILVKIAITSTYSDKAPFYISLALAPKMRVLKRGQNLELQEVERQAALFSALMGRLGVGRVQQMMGELQLQGQPSLSYNTSPEGIAAGFVAAEAEQGEITTRKEPVRNSLEREGVRFVETDNLSSAGISQVSLLTANNVVVYLQDNARSAFFRMAERALSENGVMVVKNFFRYKATFVSQIDVYQKTQGVLTYAGSNFSDFVTGKLLDQAWFAEYAGIRGTGNRFSFKAAASSATLQPFIDNAQLGSTVQAKDLGGIDFTPQLMDLRTTGDGGLAMKFNIDPAMFEEYRSSPGFRPVITSVSPLDNLLRFLGAEEKKAQQLSPGVQPIG